MSRYAAQSRSKRRALIQGRAQALRGAPTPAESRFWDAVRGRRLGVQFRRQHPIGECIADFYVPSARLVIEIDGSWHRDRGALDAGRDRRLVRAGYRVLRFTNRQVLDQLGAVLDAVRAAL